MEDLRGRKITKLNLLPIKSKPTLSKKDWVEREKWRATEGASDYYTTGRGGKVRKKTTKELQKAGVVAKKRKRKKPTQRIPSTRQMGLSKLQRAARRFGRPKRLLEP